VADTSTWPLVAGVVVIVVGMGLVIVSGSKSVDDAVHSLAFRLTLLPLLGKVVRQRSLYLMQKCTSNYLFIYYKNCTHSTYNNKNKNSNYNNYNYNYNYYYYYYYY